MAIQPDQYVALPSLYGAPAYSRPPRPAIPVERPLDPDDLPLQRHQSEEERRLADALFASGGVATLGVRAGSEPPAHGDPGYHPTGSGNHAHGPGLLPRRLNLRALTDRIRSRS